MSIKTLTVPREVVAQHLATVFVRFEGVRESPLGSNRGPMVEKFQAATTLAKSQPTGWPWCAALDAYCFQLTWRELGVQTPAFWPNTASCDEILYWARTKKIAFSEPQPYDVFLSMKSRGDATHTGLVTNVLRNMRIETCEGNTNTSGSREGIGVFTFEGEAAKSPLNRTYVRWLNLLPTFVDIAPISQSILARVLAKFKPVVPPESGTSGSTARRARLLVAVAPYGPTDYHEIKSAVLDGGNWMVDGADLLNMVRGRVAIVTAAGKLTGRGKLRDYLSAVGLRLDEKRTLLGNHLADGTDPRQYVFITDSLA